MKRCLTRLLSALTTVCAAAVLVACSSTPLSGHAPAGEGVKPAPVLAGVPLPAGTQLRNEQSLIIGGGEQWVGRAVLDTGLGAEAAVAFFGQSLPAQGWTLISSVRGKTSLMVFTRQDRSLTVEITDSLLGKASTTLTMAPVNAPVVAPRRP